MIFRISIILSILLLSWGGVRAHQPDLSSTMLVEKDENKWILQIRASLTAFEYEIEQNFGKDAYVTPEEFKGLVIKHVQNHVSILFNDNNVVTLKNGTVKLGHETSVSFEVIGTLENIRTLNIENSSFSDISLNQNALIVLKKGFSKKQFVLDKNNEHTANLKVIDNAFFLVTPAQKTSEYSILIIAGVILLGGIVFFALRKKQPLRIKLELQNA